MELNVLLVAAVAIYIILLLAVIVFIIKWIIDYSFKNIYKVGKMLIDYSYKKNHSEHPGQEEKTVS